METKRGFIGSIITVIIALALLAFIFDWDIVAFIKSPAVQNVWSYISRFFTIVWRDYISEPALFIWNNIILDILWHWAQEAFDWLRHWIDSNS